jgi:hypothetical protein
VPTRRDENWAAFADSARRKPISRSYSSKNSSNADSGHSSDNAAADRVSFRKRRLPTTGTISEWVVINTQAALWSGGGAEPDRQLVVDQLLATAGEDRRPAYAARALLVADAGPEPSDATALSEHGAEGSPRCRWRRGKQRRLVQRNEETGHEGRRGVNEMQGIDGFCRIWLPCGGRKWHLAEQWTGARRRARTSEDRRIADEAILNRTRASTIRNPDHHSSQPTRIGCILV